MTKLGTNIQKYRKAAGLKQIELGVKCGWDASASQARIGHYETGRREPSLDDLRLIAKATSVTMTKLIEGIDNSVASKIAGKMAGLTAAQQKKVLAAVESAIDMILDN